jgi:hypothetical protein
LPLGSSVRPSKGMKRPRRILSQRGYFYGPTGPLASPCGTTTGDSSGFRSGVTEQNAIPHFAIVVVGHGHNIRERVIPHFLVALTAERDKVAGAVPTTISVRQHVPHVERVTCRGGTAHHTVLTARHARGPRGSVAVSREGSQSQHRSADLACRSGGRTNHVVAVVGGDHGGHFGSLGCLLI